MAISYTIAQHAVANASKTLAAVGGKHIYNLLMDKNTDQGSIVAKDAWQGMEYYSVKDSTGVTGTILEQAANGNWYIEIDNPGDGLFVCNIALIEEEWTNNFLKESNYYIAKDSIARGYELAHGDIVEVSATGINGTPAPATPVTVANRIFKI